MTGQKFGKLTAIKRAGRNKSGKIIWQCHCDCGNKELLIPTGNLRSGNSTQCWRCKSDEMIIHHCNNKRILAIWNGMRGRCYNPNDDAYGDYGGRGIKICDEWLDDIRNFEEWSMKNGYSDELTIDRINNNGNYEPSNCRWTTMTVQARNRRGNVMLTYKGETKTVYEWEKELGVSRQTIQNRIARGITDEEEIFAKPVIRRAEKQSGVKGISWHKGSQSWQVLKFGVRLGQFKELDDAIRRLEQFLLEQQ